MGEQKKCIELRDELLRQPLGLEFSDEELEQERNLFHIAGLIDSEIIAGLILQPSSKKGEIKMRQVAVASDYQNRQIGTKMIYFSEDFAKQRGYTSIFCHARSTAFPFYSKLNWIQVGDVFQEV